MVPGDVNFPETLRRVAVVNNIPNNVLPNDENNNIRASNTKKVISLEGDAKLLVESLAQSLADAQYFDEVVICDSALRKDDKFNRVSMLSQREVSELVDELEVDFLISAAKLSLTATPYLNFLPDW